MGSITNAIKEITNADADAKLIKERLEILLTAAKAKIQLYKSEINENFTNPDQVNKKQIPGLRAIRYIEQYHVASSHSFNDVVSNHLDRAIDAFFSIGVDGTDTRNAIKGGIKALIQTALSAFVGNTSSGETEQKFYLVIPENNAFVRIDISCWKYTFDQTKVFADHDSAVAYVICKSVIDHTKLQIDELIYLTSEAISQIIPFKPADIKELQNIADLQVRELQRLCLHKFGYVDGIGKSKDSALGTKDDIDRILDILIPSKDTLKGKNQENVSEKFENLKISTNHFLSSSENLTVQDIFAAAEIRRTWMSVTSGSTIKWLLTPESIDGQGYNPKNTPDILAIEKYLEILIGVWHKLKEANKEISLT
ncbi:hypothetical protein [Acinetobacter bereziniae]|jgi:hypothetical protein|uniref:hypothetical protein n=1 Tax=Acinetobacter bereziniae TaxID=106648 RepID=UPI00300B219E